MKRLRLISEVLTGKFNVTEGEYDFQIHSYLDSGSYMEISGNITHEGTKYPCKLAVDDREVKLESLPEGLEISDEVVTSLGRKAKETVRG